MVGPPSKPRPEELDGPNSALTVELIPTVITERCHRRREVEAVMAETQIEWTDATWNPVAGCSIVSAGCTNCYAMEMAKRLQSMNVPKYEGLTRRSGRKVIWNGVVREDSAALDIPLRWKKPRKIFVNSMSDLFHERVSDTFILKVWGVMRATPQHHYQILTKRPERMGALVGSKIGQVLPNVWLGTSVENADVVSRIDHLRTVPAAIRFISFEPLIGSVGSVDLREIHWAIVGGESGRRARPIREEWIDEIFDCCALHNASFFFKQWGTWGEDNKRRSKKANGRIYRDKVWNDMPKTAPSL
jgi:protein gp37